MRPRATGNPDSLGRAFEKHREISHSKRNEEMNKRDKVLKRRAVLRKARKQERDQQLADRKEFAKANPTPRLPKTRNRRFRTKIQMVENEQAILMQMTGQPEISQSAIRSEIDHYKNDPAVQAAVERRRNDRT
jgi:hypothetical protein